ncbi:MAG: hypothetical protein ABI600_15835 [Luteolibacter sp.]
MRSLSNCIVAAILLAFTTRSLSQDTQTYGFLNLVNLVPSDKACKITLTGKDVVPGGLASAVATGWFIVPTGNIPLNLEIEGFDSGIGNIEVADAQSSIYVVFLEPNSRLDKDGKPLHPKIRIKRCEPLATQSGFYLKVMSFCPDENRFLLGTKPINLKLYEAAEIPKWSGSPFKITHNQQTAGETLPVTEKGSFYLFFGTDHSNNYCSVLVRAESQVLPPWMKQKKPTQ